MTSAWDLMRAAQTNADGERIRIPIESEVALLRIALEKFAERADAARHDRAPEARLPDL